MIKFKIKSARKNCIEKFLDFFPEGYDDPKYYAWERGYKWEAHERWEASLNKKEFKKLLEKENYDEIARRAISIETKTNLLFSFEKMALRDAVKTGQGAMDFSEGLFGYVYGKDPLNKRFGNFAETLASLPRKQTRVRTWPLQTVFGMIARPDEHIFLKPRVTQRAAEEYGFEFFYKSTPNWKTYQCLMDFAAQIKKDTLHLGPKDFIDLQSFMWVIGSDEYS